jgi:hypothetical protein
MREKTASSPFWMRAGILSLLSSSLASVPHVKRVFRHKLMIGGVVLLAAVSAGGAYAATQAGTNSRQAFFNDVAKRLNVSPSRLRSALRGAFLDRLDAAVKAGRLTQAQADRLKRRIEQSGGLPLGPIQGPMWHRGFAPGGRLRLREGLLPSAAGYLGLTPAQLIGQLRGGKSLAQVAQAQNKSVSGLEQALMNAGKARLAQLVSSGALTKAQEQRRLSRLQDRISRLVNAHPKFFKPAGDGPRGIGVPGNGPPPLPGPTPGASGPSPDAPGVPPAPGA